MYGEGMRWRITLRKAKVTKMTMKVKYHYHLGGYQTGSATVKLMRGIDHGSPRRHPPERCLRRPQTYAAWYPQEGNDV